MKKKNYTLLKVKQWILPIIVRCFNIYQYKVEHEGYGYYDYDFDLFEQEKPYLLKTLKSMRRAGITPNINDMIFGYEHTYFIKSICYYETNCCFWVDEQKTREEDEN